MRPYLAILKDSVREAVRSRTLPFLLLFFTIVLALVAPLGLRDETAWRLEADDVRDERLFAAQLRRDAGKPGDQPGDRVLALLPGDVRDAIFAPTDDPAETDDRRAARDERRADRLRRALNQSVLPDADFYEAAAFEEVDLSRPGGFFPPGADDVGEAERLLAKGPAALSADRRGRLNRLLLSAAFPQSIAAPPAERVTLVYAGYEMPEGFTEVYAGPLGLELNRSGVQFIGKTLMASIASYVAGPIGVLIGLLVTASLIPQTFEGGAIDLLLSKPVNRSLAFLTKFAGGCVFVGLAGLYLCGGLWLIAGLRLDVWDASLLAASAVLVTEFAVLYSVSAAVGVLWRNAILCVMVAGALWAGSFCLSLVHAFSKLYYEESRAAAVVAAERPGADELFAATAASAVARWDAASEEWRPVLYQPNGAPGTGPGRPVYRLSGPSYSSATDELSALEVRTVAGGRGGGPPRQIAGNRRFYTATAERDWAGTPGPTAPPGSTWLLIGAGGRPLFAGPAGVFALRDAAEGEPPAEEVGFFGGLLRELAPDAGPFEPLLRPDRAAGGRSWPEPFAAAADPRTGLVAVYAGGVLRTFSQEDTGAVRETVLFPPPGEPAGEPTDEPFLAPAVLPAVAGDAGDAVYLVEADGAGLRVAADGTVTDFAPVPGERPARWSRSADGSLLALRTHAGSVWVGDAATGAGAVVHGDASGAGFGADGALWLATSANRLTRYDRDGDGWTAGPTIGPAPSWYERFYRYGLTPAHYLLPDTAALGDVIADLFTDDEQEQAFGDDLDLREPLLEIDTLGPLIHNLSFMAAILALTCWHVARTDF